jgi:hypothetical protein
LRDDEVDQMLVLYSQGKTFKAIARSTRRHWQTVRKYVLKDLREREGKEARKEALKSALTLHFQDLTEVLQTMKAQLRLPNPREHRAPAFSWPPEDVERREQLLLQALRQEHARGSPLWGWWESWQKAWGAYSSGAPVLESRLSEEVGKLSLSYVECIITENITPVLLNQVYGVVHGSGGYDLDKLLVVRGAVAGGGLWLGQNAHLARCREQEVREALLEMERGMKEWPEVKALAGSYWHLVETRNQMEEEIEILSLRRAFPGRCRLCPV